MSPNGKAVPFNLALVYPGLGDYPRTLDYLYQAYATNSQFLVWLQIDRIYDPLREDPRFKALMRKLNFGGGGAARIERLGSHRVMRP